MKKIKSLISLFILLFTLVPAQTLSAGNLSYSDALASFDGYLVSNPLYTTSNYTISRMYIDGKLGWCIELPTLASTGDGYESTPYVSQTANLITAMASDLEAASNNAVYVAAQQMLHREIGWEYSSLTGIDSASVNAQTNAINNKINDWNKKPSFSGQTVQLKYGESVTLTDTNNVLSGYSSLKLNSAEIDYSISGNKLTLTPKSKTIDSGTLRLARPAKYGSPVAWQKTGSQTILTQGDPTVNPFSLSLDIQLVGYTKFHVIHKDIESGAVLKKTDSETYEGLIDGTKIIQQLLKRLPKKVDGEDLPYRLNKGTPNSQTVTGTYSIPTDEKTITFYYDPPKVLKYQPYDGITNNQLGSVYTYAKPVYTDDFIDSDQSAEDGHIDGLEDWMRSGQATNYIEPALGGRYLNEYEGLIKTIAECSNAYDYTIKLSDSVKVIDVPFYLPKTTVNVDKVVINTDKYTLKLPMTINVSYSRSPTILDKWFNVNPPKWDIELTDTEKGKITTYHQTYGDSKLITDRYDSTYSSKDHQIPLKILVHNQSNAAIQFDTQTNFTTKGYTSAERTFTNADLANKSLWNWQGVIQTIKERLPSSYIEKFEKITATPSGNQKKIWVDAATQTSGYPFISELNLKFENELGNASNFDFNYYLPENLIDSSLKKVWTNKASDKLVVMSGTKDVSDTAFFASSSNSTNRTDTLRVAPPFLKVKHSNDGLLYTAEQYEVIQSAGDFGDAGNLFYVAIWPDHLAEDIESGTNVYSIDLKSTKEIGNHYNSIDLTKAITVDAFSTAMDSPTIKKDEKKITPIYPHLQKVGNYDGYSWNQADIDWFKEWVWQDEKGIWHVKEVGEIKKAPR